MFDDELVTEKTEVGNVDQAENTGPEKSPDELAAEAHLAGVIGDEPEVNEGEQVQEPQLITDPAESLAGLLGMISFGFAIAGFKRLAAVWGNKDKNQAVASAAIPVMSKYAWGQRVIGMLQGDLPIQELALLMAVAPLAVGSVQAFQLDMAERRGEPVTDDQPKTGFWSSVANALGIGGK